MSVPAVGPSRLQRYLRGALVAGYVVLVVLGWTTAIQPRLFWTMLLPLLPIALVVIGFARWRNICPLAFFGEVGRWLNRGVQRRVPRWLERWFFLATFTILLAMLVLRLVAINGDGAWLAWTLVALALAAIATNWIFTGKTWCNFFCPVGLVERIYTEPRSLAATRNSECARCTACKRGCPDIDPENAYWRDVMSTGRRIATYAFPGLVLAFYTYYWLRAGDWQAYFDGRWTESRVTEQLLVGPGFFFAPGMPALPAAVLTLTLFAAASGLLFLLMETGARALVPDPERRRHLILAMAAFSAFSIFYFFAGAPTLRRISGGMRVMAFAAPVMATLFLVPRWGRRREQFIADRGAATLLRNWPYDTPPPRNARDVYARIKAAENEHERNLAAYAGTVREMVANGFVRREDLHSLVEVRHQMGISDREHAKLVARLEEEGLFSQETGAGVEESAQLAGYETALAEALRHRTSGGGIEDLRRAFGIRPDVHEKIMARMRGASGVVLQRTREEAERVRELRGDRALLRTAGSSDAASFLDYLLAREQDEGVCSILDLLEYVGGPETVRGLRPGLLSADPGIRAAAVGRLAEACRGADELVGEIGPWILEPSPTPPSEADPPGLERMLQRHASSPDPYVRAAAVWVAGGRDEPWARRIVTRARTDTRPLARELAGRLAATEPAAPASGRRYADLTDVERMQFLRTVPLFERLDPEDLHDLARLVEEETFSPPRPLCEEGDVEADDLFVLLEGRASVTLRRRDGKVAAGEREIAVLGPGEIVGELSLLDSSPRSATVRPKDGPIRVLRIPGQRFRSRLLPRSRVARPLLVTLARRIRGMSRRAVE